MKKRHYNEPGLLGPILAELMAQFPMPGGLGPNGVRNGQINYDPINGTANDREWEQHVAWLTSNAAFIAAAAAERRDEFVKGLCEEPCCVDEEE